MIVLLAILAAVAVVGFLVFMSFGGDRLEALLARRRPPAQTDQDVELDAIRAHVDGIAPRFNPDGSVNAQHTAIEQTLRARAGLPSTVLRLDGPNYRRSTDPQRA